MTAAVACLIGGGATATAASRPTTPPADRVGGLGKPGPAPWWAHRDGAARSAMSPAGSPATFAPTRSANSLLSSDRRVTALLQLDTPSAVASYRAALGRGRPAARAASRRAVAAAAARGLSLQQRVRRESPSARTVFRSSRLVPGVAVNVPVGDLAALRRLPGVRSVRALAPKRISNAALAPLVGAPRAWQSGAAGTGQGVTVGIIDTGIDYTHATFGGPGTPAAYEDARSATTFTGTAKVAGGWDLAGDAYDPDDPAHAVPSPDANPLDCDGHGTHVAGTAAGYGVTPDGQTYGTGLPGDYDGAAGDPGWFDRFDSSGTGPAGVGPGVAPLATLYALKVFGCGGTTALVIPALERAADPNGDGDVSDHLDVVNLSLGSDFASPQDPDASAVNAASLAGITVVTAIGNAGDVFDSGGSPGNAVRSIAVAASDDGQDVADGIGISTDSGVSTTTHPALLGEAYPWVNGAQLPSHRLVQRLDTWSTPRTGNNSDGCDPLTTGQQAAVRGKVALLWWDGWQGRCPDSFAADQVRAAGAVGVVLGSRTDSLALGFEGLAGLPTALTTRTAANALASAGTSARVTLSAALRGSQQVSDPARVDQIAGFSSRGRRAAGGLKPDVAAPGVTVYSAAVGSGSGGQTSSGTSMAAPVVAGQAALVRAAHPSWTPEQVKAAIVNTAGRDVRSIAGEAVGPTRSGSGRVDVEGAVRADTLVADATTPGAVGVSFGVVAATADVTRTRQVRISNLSDSDRTYTVAVQDVAAVPGVRYRTSLDPSIGGTGQISVPAGAEREITVELEVDRAALRQVPQPGMATSYDYSSGTVPLTFDRQYVTEALARLQVTEAGGATSRLPIAASVRPASTLTTGTTSVSFSASTGTATVTLAGTGVANGPSAGPGSVTSRGQGFALAATSGRLPDCGPTLATGCIPYPDARAADLRYVGVTSNARAIRSSTQVGFDPASDNLLTFALSSHGPWATPAGYASFGVYLDTDRDRRSDFLLTTGRSWYDEDVLTAELHWLFDGMPILWDVQPLNGWHGSGNPLGFGGADTAPFDSDTLTLPVFTGLLDAPSSRINYRVVSDLPDLGRVDTVGSTSSWLTVDAVRPAIRVAADGVASADSTYVEQPGRRLVVTKNAASYRTDAALGELFVHFHNGDGTRAERRLLRQRQSILVPSSLTTGHRRSAGAFRVGARSTSGLAVTVRVSPSSVCSYANGSITPRGAGTCRWTLSQPGSSTYDPATTRTGSFRVT
ncbi:MAG: S8 family serine peptidase [Angustibacter sp.]